MTWVICAYILTVLVSFLIFRYSYNHYASNKLFISENVPLCIAVLLIPPLNMYCATQLLLDGLSEKGKLSQEKIARIIFGRWKK